MLKAQIIILSTLCCNFMFCQSIAGFKIPDSLKNRSGKELISAYDKVFKIDNEKAELYANAILLKGKITKDSTLVYEGYYNIGHVKGFISKNGHPFADSLLFATQKVITKEYPAKAHILKGILQYYDLKYSAALDEYIRAQDLAKDKNTDQYFYVKKLIAILKTASDEHKEALPLFLEYYQYEKNKIDHKNGDVKSYIGSIYSVANSYSKNGKFEKSKFYNGIGLKECKRYKDHTHYSYLMMSEGIANFYLKNDVEATNNLLFVEKEFFRNNDYGNLAITYYFLGKINDRIQKEKKAIGYFLKTDSLSFALNKFYPVTRDGYERLIDYYKNKNDQKNQLKYINHLFYADSVMAINSKFVAKDIYKKYDTPLLLKNKQSLINKLANKNTLQKWFLISGLLLILGLLVIYLRVSRRLNHYRRQAATLLENIKAEDVHQANMEKEEIKLPHMIRKGKTSLTEENYQEIKAKIIQFESSAGFTRKNLTLEKIAKDLDTNRDYLSRFINEEMGKNFSQYLNDLRINYILLELKNNKKLRKYTISAIADEVGFSNSESFSNAFRRTTGTLPSYYLKLLDKETAS